MSIDADLNAGLIDEQGAKEKRQNLQKEADFMDLWMVLLSL